MIKQLAAYTALWAIFISCSNEKIKESSQPPTASAIDTLKVDTASISINQLDEQSNWMQIFKNTKANNSTLSYEQLQKTERILTQCLNEYNRKQRFKILRIKKEPAVTWGIDSNDFVIDLKRYKRQYYPVINKKGELEVWVNCFCKHYHNYENPDWKKGNTPVLVKDGGNCYFNLKIHLTLAQYYDLMVNGSA